jgi:hypothetical protein
MRRRDSERIRVAQRAGIRAPVIARVRVSEARADERLEATDADAAARGLDAASND